jgi:hypothetical protein
VITVNGVELVEAVLLLLTPFATFVSCAEFSFEEFVSAPQRAIGQHTADSGPQIEVIGYFFRVLLIHPFNQPI